MSQNWFYTNNGEKTGPVSTDHLKELASNGTLQPTDLIWKPGFPNWVQANKAKGLFPSAAAPEPPPVPKEQSERSQAPEHGSTASPENNDPKLKSPDFDQRQRQKVVERAGIPTPPSLHWAWVAILSICTFGIFGLVWSFIQANWVKKVDQNSKAIIFLATAVGCCILALITRAFAVENPTIGMILLVTALNLTAISFFIASYFSMSRSICRFAAKRELNFEISGITLFVFNVLYLQGHIRWLCRWVQTGDTNPKAPKRVFWLLLIVPIVLALLAATFIPMFVDDGSSSTGFSSSAQGPGQGTYTHGRQPDLWHLTNQTSSMDGSSISAERKYEIPSIDTRLSVMFSCLIKEQSLQLELNSFVGDPSNPSNDSAFQKFMERNLNGNMVTGLKGRIRFSNLPPDPLVQYFTVGDFSNTIVMKLNHKDEINPLSIFESLLGATPSYGILEAYEKINKIDIQTDDKGKIIFNPIAALSETFPIAIETFNGNGTLDIVIDKTPSVASVLTACGADKFVVQPAGR